MLSVENRSRVARKRRSHSSIASQRWSSGERFQRSQEGQTTQSRPRAGSNGSRVPTGKVGRTAFPPSGALQKRQVANMGFLKLPRRPTGAPARRGRGARSSRGTPDGGRSDGGGEGSDPFVHPQPEHDVEPLRVAERREVGRGNVRTP